MRYPAIKLCDVIKKDGSGLNTENREGRLIIPKNYYYLAECYEMKERRAKATDHYEKFLELWKDAGPGIAEVEDAKQRLAGLKSQ